MNVLLLITKSNNIKVGVFRFLFTGGLWISHRDCTSVYFNLQFRKDFVLYWSSKQTGVAAFSAGFLKIMQIIVASCEPRWQAEVEGRACSQWICEPCEVKRCSEYFSVRGAAASKHLCIYSTVLSAFSATCSFFPPNSQPLCPQHS